MAAGAILLEYGSAISQIGSTGRYLIENHVQQVGHRSAQAINPDLERIGRSDPVNQTNQ
jgi:hypothetical protein